MTASRSSPFRLVTTLAVALASVAVQGTPLAAQYFGRNKVTYRTFDFRIMRTEHFDLYFYPEEETAVHDAGRMAERWYARFSRLLDHQFQERQPVVLYASHPQFQQTGVLSGDISEGTGGVTEVFQQRVVLPFAASYRETDHVLGHELVHAFQYDISGLGRAQGGLEAAAQRFQAPLWFIEGMAEYLSLGPVDPNTAMWMRDAALSGQIPSLEAMTNDPRVFPYRWGEALWAYVGGRWGDAVIGQILKQTGQGVPYDEAFQRILNEPLEDIVDDWHASIRRAYLPLLNQQREAREVARPLITSRREGGQLNVSPSLSPDGRWVAFLSERQFIDVELYLANAETGEVVRRLVRGTAFDPHFGSLRYINSAGTWSPDSRQFAFSALRDGSDEVAIIDVGSGNRVREYRIPGVSEITNPTWSPDGTTIMVSGQGGGITDLYAIDVRTGTSRRITDDRFADLQPSYSPDGRTVAFVTDRGEGTDLDALSYGPYRIALMDVASGAVRYLPRMEGRNNINPSWSRDGRSLYFISNRTGIPNVYRIDVESGALSVVTNLFTGVSGITDLSPAITSARTTDRVLFSAFERGGYNIYSLTEPQRLAGTPVTAPTATAPSTPNPSGQATSADSVPNAALLPPVPRPSEAAFNRVSLYLNDARTGLPAPTATFAVAPYRPHLILNYLGQPQVGVSTGSAYSRGGLYGGIAGIFSDVLGYHTLFGAVQAQGQLDEIGFSTVYLYQKYRWNYGVAAQRIPYIALGQNIEYDPSDDLVKDQLIRLRIFDTSLQGVAQYPFSQVRRVEFTGGLRRLAQSAKVQQISGPPVVQNGQIVSYYPSNYDEFEDPRYAASYNLAEGSVAYVYDSSLLGYTSPFAGQRYRFEVTPTFGTLQFTQALADYRRYLYLRPFTLAVRGLHFGRYGRDSEGGTQNNNNLFQPIYLGHPSLIRGYDFSNLYDECQNNRNSCGLINSLFGTRIAVANAELRFPLLRQVVVGNSFGLPPIEGFAFYDAGVAWQKGTDPVFRRGLQGNPKERGIVTSAGVGTRINVFGYLILEIDYVNAIERNNNWRWQFSIQPGF